MTGSISFICNDKTINTNSHPGTTLLDYLRNELKLTGTKEGCREGDCGACTVIIGSLNQDKVKYHSVNSCLFPLGSINGKHVVTVEGLNLENLNSVQQVFADEGGTQCGFCTPGFLVSFTGYLLNAKKVNFDDAVDSVAGNVCRCTGHVSIRRAINKLVEKTEPGSNLDTLIEQKFIPSYFAGIPSQLNNLSPVLPLYTEGNGSGDSFLIAGGTDLYVREWEGILSSNVELLSIEKNVNLIFEKDGECFIDAKSTVSDISSSILLNKYIPAINSYLKLFGSLPIRNRATVGGNIINASPIADMTSIFLALDSTLHLEGKNGLREVSLKNFFKSYKTLDKENDEILNQISFNLPAKNSYFNFEKVSRRMYLDIATVNTSIYLEVNNGIIISVHISAGGVAPIPLYLNNSVTYLTNKEINSINLKQFLSTAINEISPISDVRGSAEYKTLLLRQLLLAHFIKIFPGLVNIEEFV